MRSLSDLRALGLEEEQWSSGERAVLDSGEVLGEGRFWRVTEGRVDVGGGVEVLPEVSRVFSKFLQAPEGGLEAGGLLMGSVSPGGRLVVRSATEPGPRDVRTSHGFVRSDLPHHQQGVVDAWVQHGGSVAVVGSWHTHPQLVPAPSILDVESWCKDTAMFVLQGVLPPGWRFVYCIVGLTHVGLWEVRHVG